MIQTSLGLYISNFCSINFGNCFLEVHEDFSHVYYMNSEYASKNQKEK